MVKINAPLEDMVEAQGQLIMYLACAMHSNDVLPLSDFADGIREETKTSAVSDAAKTVMLTFADEMDATVVRITRAFTVIAGGKNDDPEPDDDGSA